MKRVIQAELSKNIKPKDLRKVGKVPACCYGPGVEGALSVNIEKASLTKLVNVVSGSTIVDLQVDGKKVPVLLHEVQRDPVTEDVRHVDFYSLDVSKPVTVTVPLQFEGNPDGVRVHHGILVTEKNEVTATCLPKDLVDAIQVDTNVLTTLGSFIHISELVVPTGIEVLDNPEVVVAHIVAPKIMSVEEEEAEAAEAAEAMAEAGDESSEETSSEEES